MIIDNVLKNKINKKIDQTMKEFKNIIVKNNMSIQQANKEMFGVQNSHVKSRARHIVSIHKDANRQWKNRVMELDRMKLK